ncbi:hypothetical protein [Burkholderia multivorans]|nr:hypothetical protein [Burkholderia multivorans]MBU9597634.1 hypothetical protein [Burkholderia multivorans]MDN8000185.1 hypothetical protein [Burkholderia multivorans]
MTDSVAFENWVRSDAFRAAHSGAGGNSLLYPDHQQFDGAEVVQTLE